MIKFNSICWGQCLLLRILLSINQPFLLLSHQFMHDSDKRAHWFCFSRITIGLSLICYNDQYHSKINTSAIFNHNKTMRSFFASTIPIISSFWFDQRWWCSDGRTRDGHRFKKKTLTTKLLAWKNKRYWENEMMLNLYKNKPFSRMPIIHVPIASIKSMHFN